MVANEWEREAMLRNLSLAGSNTAKLCCESPLHVRGNQATMLLVWHQSFFLVNDNQNSRRIESPSLLLIDGALPHPKCCST